jgi:hypothetical protein
MTGPKTVSPQLTRLSTVMAWVAMLGAILLPSIAAACFLFPGSGTDWLMFRLSHTGAEVTAQIPLQYRAIALLLNYVPIGFEVWALLALRRLFLLYAHGEVFSEGALKALNRVAAGLFWSVVSGFVVQAPISLALTWPNAKHEISLGFGSDDVMWLFIAGAVLVIARVMTEARRVADENASFV